MEGGQCHWSAGSEEASEMAGASWRVSKSLGRCPEEQVRAQILETVSLGSGPHSIPY